MEDTTNVPTKFYHEYKVSESSFELIKVADTQRNQEHYLLVKTTYSKLGTDSDGDSVIMTASMSVEAHYIFGSRLNLIGQLVSEMGASINGFGRSTRLTNGSVMIRVEDLKGLHIGTYLFYKIVNWAITHAPGYKITPISLSNCDAGEDNKDRRNAFYEHFGLVFDYRTENGVEKASGCSKAALTTDDLIRYQHWPNISVQHLHSGLKDLAHSVDRMRRSLFEAKRCVRMHVRDRNKKNRKLQILAICINWPLYIFFTLIGVIVGRGLGHL